MPGTALLPYEKYEHSLRLVIERTRADLRRGRKAYSNNWKKCFVLLAIAMTIFFIALYLSIEERIQHSFTIGLIMGGMVFILGFVFENLAINQKLKVERQTFACPHCEREVPSGQKWVCGWCGHENGGVGLVSFLRTCIFDACEHEVCGKQANAIRCPHEVCGRDIIIDPSSYEMESRHNVRRRPGVAVLRERLSKAEEVKTPSEKSADTTSKLERDIM